LVALGRWGPGVTKHCWWSVSTLCLVTPGPHLGREIATG